MGPWKKMLVHVAWSGLFISGSSGAALPAAAQQAVVRDKPAQVTTNSMQPTAAKVEDQAATGTQPRIVELPDSPGTVAAKAEQSAQATQKEPRWELASAAQQSANAPQSGQSQSSTSQQEASPQKPVGTAAAEAPNVTGVAASQPAGVAIAPAKQRRVRTIILRTGALIGAGVAVGSVVALTAGTSSKPPGAH